MKIVPIYGGSIFSTKYWNNKVLFFLKTALLKNKIITIFVKLVHKSFVSWNKKSSLEYTFKSSATCKHQTASCGLSYWLMLLLLVLLVSVHHNNKCHRDTLYSWHVIVHNKYLPDCLGTLRQPWHHDTTNPMKNQTTLRQHKPQPRHLTSTKSDPGFKSRFLD